MLNLSDSTILIVGETPDVSDLRTRLIESGATVHVVSVAGAALMVRQKQVDSAFIAANLDEITQQLCAELDSLGIARVFLTPEHAALQPRFVSGQLKNLRRKLRTAAIA
jgi:energy-converting hydrogenase Eha subunit E